MSTIPNLSPRLKMALAALGLVAVGVIVWLVMREAREGQRLEQWDVYGQLRAQNESEEQFFEGDAPLYQAARDRYVRELQAFVATLADQAPVDALEAQVRWRIVRTEGESLISLKEVLDISKRLPHTENALKQLEILQSKFPDFPLNWGQAFAPPGFGSMTKKLAHWFRENAAWEREHLPKDLAPDPGVVVVLRTQRGDLHLGLYSGLAPIATARLLADVQRGTYDGTCFVQRRQDTHGGETRVDAVRAGDARSRGAKAYDPHLALAYAKPEAADGMLPDESRNRVQHLRGVVTSWHVPGDPYDHPSQLLFVVRASPGLNYENTPLGRLLGEASLATLDRIHAGSLWRDDPVVGRDAGELRDLTDVYREPVLIEKALAYRDGRLLTGDLPPLATKAKADESEQTLATLKLDAYKQDPLPPPAVPVDDDPK